MADKEVSFPSFEAFVTAPLVEGLGTTIRQLKQLCRDDKSVQNLIDQACQKGPGAPKGNQNARREKTTFDNVQDSKAPTGNSESAAIRRLRKDRPDLLVKVEAHELTANAAMIEAGFRKPS